VPTLTRELTPQEVIRHLVAHDLNVSVDEIVAKLEQLGLNVPTRYYIASFKGYVRDVLRFLQREGLLVERQHKLPASMRGPRKRVLHQNENDALHTGEGELLAWARVELSFHCLKIVSRVASGCDRYVAPDGQTPNGHDIKLRLKP
jgi:hypothetical protein